MSVSWGCFHELPGDSEMNFRGRKYPILVVVLTIAGSIIVAILVVMETLPERMELGTILRTRTATPSPSQTPKPLNASATAIPMTVTPTMGPTVTDFPVPGADFSGAYVHGVAELEFGRSMIRLVVPAGVEGEYTATVTAENELAYQCFIPNGYSDRIYCFGPRLNLLEVVFIEVRHRAQSGSPEKVVFETEFRVAGSLPTPTSGP